MTHFMKDTTRSMLHRVTGSATFAQTCRSLMAMVARDDDGPYEKAMMQVKLNLPEHPGGAWRFKTEKVTVGYDPDSQRPINATHPVWESLDRDLTPQSVMGGSRGPVGNDYGTAFGIWLKAHFLTTDPEQGLPVSQVKSAAINVKICSQKWWAENSGQFLEKRNVNGIWMCRPTAQPIRN